MPRGGKSSKEGQGFSRRSNLQNSMAAISTGISLQADFCAGITGAATVLLSCL